jgi:hypothetical protein
VIVVAGVDIGGGVLGMGVGTVVVILSLEGLLVQPVIKITAKQNTIIKIPSCLLMAVFYSIQYDKTII